MTAVKCAAEGYFMATGYHYCLTREKCLGGLYAKYIYSAVSECTNITPDQDGGFASTTDLIYTCPEDRPYIDLGATARCVSAETCRVYGYTLDVAPYRECARLEKCGLRGYFVHKATRRCITAEACLALSPRHYAYKRNHLCASLEPEIGCSNCPSETTESGVYECPSSYSYVDLSGDKAKCTTSSACAVNNYVFSDGPLNECTSAKKCISEGYLVAQD